jgi:hypothetical protein
VAKIVKNPSPLPLFPLKKAKEANFSLAWGKGLFTGCLIIKWVPDALL